MRPPARVIVLVSKRTSQIIECRLPAAFVEMKGQRADPSRKRHQHTAWRQSWQNPGHSLQHGGFEEIAELLHEMLAFDKSALR